MERRRNKRGTAGRQTGGNRKQAVFNKLLNDENAHMRGRHQALRFLEGMEDFCSKAQLLSLITDERKNGAKCLGEILSYLEDSLDSVNGLLIPLLRHGINAETAKPLYRATRDKYLHLLYLVPGVVDFLASHKDTIVRSLELDSARLLCTFLLLVARAIGEARSNESVADIARSLSERDDIRDADTLCAVLLLKERDARNTQLETNRQKRSTAAGTEVACWATDRIPPGERHSNDRFNYRDISIVPRADELRCQKPPYLPLASGENNVIEDPVSRLLDKNFRLLREDALSTMRVAIAEKPRAWSNARVIDVSCEWSDVVFFVQLDPPRRIIKDWHKARALNYQSVVAFLSPDGNVLRTGIITKSEDKEEDKWLNDPVGPIIGVSFEEDIAFDEAAEEMVFNKRLDTKYNAAIKQGRQRAATSLLSKMKSYEMIEISKSFFAYHPILKALQSLDGIPFQDELLRAEEPADSMLDYLTQDLTFPRVGNHKDFVCKDFVHQLTAEKLESVSSLDLSQARAVRRVLTSRVALVQGPPGTGKTFIGGLVARIILDNSSEKILCVCYTNHALDQFLEHLHDAGKTDIVRLGGRTKSEKVAKYELRRLAKAKGGVDNESNRLIKRIDAQRYQIRDRIKTALADLETPITWNSPNGGTKIVLQDEFPEVYELLSFQGDFDFQKVGRRGKKMKDDYLWEEWKNDKGLPPFALVESKDPVGLTNFWNMPELEKIEFIEMVERSAAGEPLSEIRKDLKALKDLSLERETASRERDLQILRHASIIGATTSGAAKYRDVLSEISPGVLIVEEAGEVLESHVLTSLSSESCGAISVDTKHLILIGDHKQLRPKVESYNLTKASGKGYDLDVSLFERLILGGLPYSTLEVQHRMRPEISNFIRDQTYPTLIDHNSVKKFPSIRGVQNNVVFIDHDFAEDSQEADSLDPKRVSTTKSNEFEAVLCIEIVRYFLLQGYSPGQIVVLTPYLGQLSKIIRLMRKELRDVEAYISEKDLEEFGGEEHDGLEETTTIKKVHTVRCSSIDNYQGEENDIVIASLVRCNKNGSIGFLTEPQRVNVLLSRARYGMFIVGSFKTLLRKPAGQKTWSKLYTMMSDTNQIRKGLPTVCQLHPEDSEIELCSRDQFRRLRPNGGCDRPCKYRLSCGHTCQSMCHPIDRDHSLASKQCTQPCRRIPPECNHNHPCTRLCNQPCGPCRTTLNEPFKMLCGHTYINMICHEVRSPEAIEMFSKTCRKKVVMNFARCGHVAETTCANARSQNPICPKICGQIIDECQHPCMNECSSCDGNHNCKKRCERTLFCGHICGRPCHPGECEPCELPCVANCIHSKCPKPCGEPCASCVEECDWECDHMGRCELVCGAPCTRLPCNQRCSKILACGHRCPSVCGEPCPHEKFCVECGSDAIKSSVVDFIELKQYKDHDLDNDPVIFLSCGHFFGMESLDGHLEMDKVYETTTTGKYFATKSLLDSGISDRPKQCPQCRIPSISSVRRYGRILKFAALRSLERKHMAYIGRTLEILSQKEKKSLKTLYMLRKEMEMSPMRRVHDACESLQRASEVEVQNPSPILFLKVLQMTAQVHGSKVKEEEDDHYKKAYHLFLEAITLATESGSWRSSASIRIGFTQLVSRWMEYNDKTKKKDILEHLGWIISHESPSVTEFVAIAKELKEQVGSKELTEVVKAMNVVMGYDYGGGASAHWYECPNGHPYFIGECGGAMQRGRCIECGAEVGGGGHRLIATNRTWNGLDNHI